MQEYEQHLAYYEEEIGRLEQEYSEGQVSDEDYRARLSSLVACRDTLARLLRQEVLERLP